ncbi:MAG: pyridoxamine 5'-phosphate oxidase family protein [Dehalococcoidia bacterium]|nr:pyridoxamine 5'-phosphate oxidase family protein [Dehalococcoidia bacterium]
MTLVMTKDERERFLAAVRIGIVAVAEEGRGPLAVPVWYEYEPGGEIRFTTGADSRKAKALRAAGRASFTVQQETLPYAYVMAEGPVTIEEPDFERDVRALAVRYLGEQGAARYLGGSTDTSGSVLVRIRPERWLSVDYAKQGRQG